MVALDSICVVDPGPGPGPSPNPNPGPGPGPSPSPDTSPKTITLGSTCGAFDSGHDPMPKTVSISFSGGTMTITAANFLPLNTAPTYEYLTFKSSVYGTAYASIRLGSGRGGSGPLGIHDPVGATASMTDVQYAAIDTAIIENCGSDG